MVYVRDFELQFLARNISVSIILLFLEVIPGMVALVFLFNYSVMSFVNAAVFFFSALPILLVLGNYLSIILPYNLSMVILLLRYLYGAAMLILSLLPYFVFKIELGSRLLCLAVGFPLFAIWYFVSIPMSAISFEKRKYKLVESSWNFKQMQLS